MASIARGPKQPQQELLELGPVAAARNAVMARRATEGPDVKQADVDLVAEALVRAAVRPYPRAIVSVIGGSLSTVTPMFDDWWQRFAIRNLDPHTPGLDAQSKISLHFRHLVGQWESVLREHLKGAADPSEALIAAAKLGEQQGLRAQLSAVTAERNRLIQSLEAITYKVASVEAQMTTLDVSKGAAENELLAVLARLNQWLDRPVGPPDKNPSVAALSRLTREIKQLRNALAQTERRQTPHRRREPSGRRSRRAQKAKVRLRGTTRAAPKRRSRKPR